MSGGIIEARNDGHTATHGEDGKFTGSEPYADDDGGAEKTTKNAAGQTVKIVDHINLKGDPNSITQIEYKKGAIDRNYYGNDGMLSIQICNSDHGHPKQHPFGKNGEHAHDFKYDKNENLISRIPRDLTDEEREDNGDIL